MVDEIESWETQNKAQSKNSGNYVYYNDKF